ncbi:MAG: phosphatidylinositol-specific phospholipase C/glycerophosphodiester phosphodiesterase family protein [Actinomycetota bacterium]
MNTPSLPRVRATLIIPTLILLLTSFGTAIGAAQARDTGVRRTTSESSATPLARAHAHNDYLHARPLFDAIDHGFTSVEADIWLVDGELLVAHDFEDVQPGVTLESLYLDPLRKLVSRNKGNVYPGHPHYFTLLVDIKSEAVSTYLALHERLKKYQRVFTSFGPSGVKNGAVTAIVSGNRPIELMRSQRIRYAGVDGRMSDLGVETSQTFMPLISDNWTRHFSWMGAGPMPEEERQKLHGIVATAHSHGQRVRFWETPDEPGEVTEAVWQELLEAGVDYLNTDHLDELQEFLLTNDPNPSVPHVTWEES